MKKIARSSSKVGYESTSEIDADIRMYSGIIEATKDEMVADDNYSDMYLDVIVDLTELVKNLNDLKNNFNLIKIATNFVNL